jgi:hypothetical protein
MKFHMKQILHNYKLTNIFLTFQKHIFIKTCHLTKFIKSVKRPKNIKFESLIFNVYELN